MQAWGGCYAADDRKCHFEPIFGIGTLGTVSTNSAYFTVSQTFSLFLCRHYNLPIIHFSEPHPFNRYKHRSQFPSLILVTGQGAVAEPAIWTYNYGTGTTVTITQQLPIPWPTGGYAAKYFIRHAHRRIKSG